MQGREHRYIIKAVILFDLMGNILYISFKTAKLSSVIYCFLRQKKEGSRTLSAFFFII